MSEKTATLSMEYWAERAIAAMPELSGPLSFVGAHADGDQHRFLGVLQEWLNENYMLYEIDRMGAGNWFAKATVDSANIRAPDGSYVGMAVLCMEHWSRS